MGNAIGFIIKKRRKFMEIIYRADDGTEFRNQTDCLLHERMSNLSHNKVINVKLAFFDVTKKLAKKYYN